jgi:hypothetical protein
VEGELHMEYVALRFNKMTYLVLNDLLYVIILTT